MARVRARRQWLGMALAGGVTASVGVARTTIGTMPTVPSDMAPRQALDALHAGNRRFVAGGIFDLATGRVAPVDLG